MKKGNVAILVSIIVIVITAVVLIMVTNQRSDDRRVNSEAQTARPLNAPPNTQTATTSAATQPFQGRVIAGTSAPFIEFNKADYEAAKKAGKVIVLDFYANWCPICRAEAPDIQAGFNSLTTDNVVGFRVNYNDDETDADETALAKQFGINYQHTKVIVKDGKQVLKTSEIWNKETLIKEITKVTQ